MRSFLLLHGWQNRRPPGHWHRLLADALLAEGHQVLYPQLPEPDEPVLDDWLLDLRRSLAAQRGDERVLICHSLSVLLWWQAAAGLGPLQPDRVLLVAPPSPDLMRQQLPTVAAFAPVGMEAHPPPAEVRQRVRLVVSDAGYGPWPSLLAWCSDPSERIVGR